MSRRARHPLSNTWSCMIARCHNPNHHAYKNYGGRGIVVCEKWRRSFKAFLEDMGPRPERHTIERIDNDGIYEPSNCCWATRHDQNRNKRNTRRITIAGISEPAASVAERVGISTANLMYRVRRGWSDITIPKAVYVKKRRIDYVVSFGVWDEPNIIQRLIESNGCNVAHMVGGRQKIHDL